jgi:hypothetical protein
MPSDAPLTQAEYDAIVEPARKAYWRNVQTVGSTAIAPSPVLQLDDYIHWLRHELKLRDEEIKRLKA